MTARDQVLSLLQWTVWQPLQGAWLANRLPSLPGLYRIRRVGHDDIDYIGQTGSGLMSLKKRIGMLSGVFADVMPYRDPHTAGPALWALRHEAECDFEVSVCQIDGTVPWRKGMECVAISIYRKESGHSPTIEFGRMPVGYRMSTGNNSRLVVSGKRFRGGPFDALDESHLPGIVPLGLLAGDPQSNHWCGHQWSSWNSVQEAVVSIASPTANGLYRIRRAEESALAYIGQGRVGARLAEHVRKATNPSSRQANLFAGNVECSWVLSETWFAHQRLELENDLIAAYVLEMGSVPGAQFLG